MNEDMFPPLPLVLMDKSYKDAIVKTPYFALIPSPYYEDTYITVYPVVDDEIIFCELLKVKLPVQNTDEVREYINANIKINNANEGYEDIDIGDRYSATGDLYIGLYASQTRCLDNLVICDFRASTHWSNMILFSNIENSIHCELHKDTGELAYRKDIKSVSSSITIDKYPLQRRHK